MTPISPVEIIPQIPCTYLILASSWAVSHGIRAPPQGPGLPHVTYIPGCKFQRGAFGVLGRNLVARAKRCAPQLLLLSYVNEQPGVESLISSWNMFRPWSSSIPSMRSSKACFAVASTAQVKERDAVMVNVFCPRPRRRVSPWLFSQRMFECSNAFSPFWPH